MKNMEQNEQRKQAYRNFYKRFKKHRNNILEDIKNFLRNALECLHELNSQVKEKERVTAKISERLHRLIKSLCLIHALYGYPGELSDNAEGISIDKNFIKDTVENLKNKDKFTDLLNGCQVLNDDQFWIIGDLDKQNLDTFYREPAHVFLEMVQQVYSEHHEDPFAIVRKYLKNLESNNLLKPAVWAEHKEKSSYGVSVGVGAFVRPLYLYKKLCTLEDGENGERITCNDVNAFKILHTENENEKNTKISPCLTCQCRFGFTSPPIIGNCAEYDVIGNVGPEALKTDGEWKKFKLACEGHIAAFNRMNQEIMRSNQRLPGKIIKEYFGKTYSSMPKVLKYEFDFTTKGHKLIAMTWPQIYEHQCDLTYSWQLRFRGCFVVMVLVLIFIAYLFLH